MGWFLAWPVDAVAAILGALAAVLLACLAILARRATLLRKLGTRNVARRPLRAGLVVFGLMLSTTVVGTALGTGDTITHTLQAMVSQSLGSVDEVVVLSAPGGRLLQQVREVARPGIGALAGANLSFFPEAEVARVRTAAEGSTAIAGLAPAIVDQVTVVNEARQQLQSRISLLAVPAAFPAAFGADPGQGSAVWQSLGSDEIVANQAAADMLGAGEGATLQLLRGGEPRNVRVRAVTSNIAISGNEPLLLVRLDHYARLIGNEGQINLVLVANRGGPESVARSAEATRALRSGIADQGSARQLWSLLGRPEIQPALVAAESRLPPRERQRFAALRAEAARSTMTEEFVSLVSEPRTRHRLFFLARLLPLGDERRTTMGAIQSVAPLAVLAVKQEALDQANEYGAVITTIFLVLGVFSIAAAILLIFLIFSLLAADRAGEMATMRALGMRRPQIMAMFLLEGTVYNLLGAVLGTLASLGAAYLLVILLARALRQFDVQLDPSVEPRSLVAALAAGVLLAFAAMLVAARRVSRLDIVAATRGVAIGERGIAQPVGAVLLLLAAAYIWTRWRTPAVAYTPRHPLVAPTAAMLALLGAALLAQTVVRRRQAGNDGTLRAAVASLGGAGIGLVWLRALLSLPTARGEITADALTLALGGFTLVLSAVATVIWSLGPLLKLVDRGLSRWGRLRAVIRPAGGYLGQQQWRTAMTVVMFGTVICIMVLALTLIHVALQAYAGDEPPVAGYDLRADVRAPAAGGPAIEDLEAALATAPAVSREAFATVGGVTQQETQIIPFELPAATWRDATLEIADDDFLHGMEAGMEWRAEGYTAGPTVWRAVAEQPGTAVVTARFLRDNLDGEQMTSPDRLAPLTLWARAGVGGRPLKLSVIGVVDARSQMEDGVYISRGTAAGLGIPLSPPATYFLAVRPGTQLQDVAAGLRMSFEDRGLSVAALSDTYRLVQAIRTLLTRIVQGFMGLGLIAGIAALGLLGVQSVIERRKDLGTLRALGFTRAQVRWSLVFEATVVVALGIGVGTGLGLILARGCVAMLEAYFPEVRLAVPWQEIGVTMAMASLGSVLPILLAAWSAGRVSPAEALKAG